jgi:hypothetical protein
MSEPAATKSPRRWWLWVLAGALAIPALACIVLIASVGKKGSDALSLARGLCAEHPVGSAVDVSALERSARERGLNVRVSSERPGQQRVEASSGALTRVHTCAIDVAQGRVTTNAVRSED